MHPLCARREPDVVCGIKKTTTTTTTSVPLIIEIADCRMLASWMDDKSELTEILFKVRDSESEGDEERERQGGGEKERQRDGERETNHVIILLKFKSSICGTTQQ